MGFLDKAKKLAEQAQAKIDDAQKQFNEPKDGTPGPGPAVEYDEHGRPIPRDPEPAGDPQPSEPPGSREAPPRFPSPDPAQMPESTPPMGGGPSQPPGDPAADPHLPAAGPGGPPAGHDVAGPPYRPSSMAPPASADPTDPGVAPPPASGPPPTDSGVAPPPAGPETSGPGAREPRREGEDPPELSSGDPLAR